ncbi:hypothetical protein UFOVP222_16 [uncultured Caudovirales phage]|uniref:Uncharacterized protein n=1 Tax=uncultured Caudovirales phage TaxID=2100421 RepID=A0A6J5TBN8_9CAUD|nr:hypothetical protein UFOVP108_11 [uncultured Caudovirales phage]CAB5219001.1 hypothetical protein UFOVP222_16 [uncultured Caudovirales phage]
MFKKQDGYYWVKQNDGSKIGYPSLVSLVTDEPAPATIAYLLSVVVIGVSLLLIVGSIN